MFLISLRELVQWAHGYLSILRLKLIHVEKRGPGRLNKSTRMHFSQCPVVFCLVSFIVTCQMTFKLIRVFHGVQISSLPLFDMR